MTDVPDGLGEAGASLWRYVLDEFDLAADDLAVLAETCRTADELEVMRRALTETGPMLRGSMGQPIPNGLFAEMRAHRQLLVKLLGELALPGEDEEVGKTPNQQRASKAAQTRWELEKRRGRTA